jgi:hypothetical protein
MNMSMRLTMDGLVRALRWQGLQAADLHQTRDQMGANFEPVGAVAARVVEHAAKDRKP